MSMPIPPEYQPVNPPRQPARAPSRRRVGVAAVIGALVLILAILVILNETAFRIRVTVNGNRTVSDREVVEAAGLLHGASYFTVNEAQIKKGINENRYLIYEKIEKVFPNSLTIYVRERAPVAKVQEMGVVYHLDEEGMVLEKYNELYSEEEAVNDSGLIIVTGLKPKEIRVGRMVVASSSAQEEAYRALIQELTLQGWLGQVGELNVNDPANLYLYTRDNYRVRLGDLSNLRAKIGTVRAVVDKLREMGYTGGTLDATIPGQVDYARAT